MSRRLDRLAGLAVVLAVWVAPISGQAPAAEQSIRELATQFERAWNTHEMNILGSITTEDVDFVNVAGLHWKGRAEVVREHAERFRTPPRTESERARPSRRLYRRAADNPAVA